MRSRNQEMQALKAIFRFSVNILTKYEDNNGNTENCLEVSGETLEARQVLGPLSDIAES